MVKRMEIVDGACGKTFAFMVMLVQRPLFDLLRTIRTNDKAIGPDDGRSLHSGLCFVAHFHPQASGRKF